MVSLEVYIACLLRILNLVMNSLGLGIQLMEALDLKEINCRVSLSFNAATRFYQEPLSASLDPLLEAHQIGIETGRFLQCRL